MRIPFGRHRGLDLHDAPLDYLQWLDSLGTLREPLATAVKTELAARRDPAAPDPLLARQVIDTGYKALALRHHPDRGGELRTMQMLNSTVTWLRRSIEVIA